MRKMLLLIGALTALHAGALYAGEERSSIDEATKVKIRQEIERYVRADTQLKKSFLLVDPRTDRILRLTFDHVHEDIMPHANGYVACTDFKDRAGKVYDVDIVIDPMKEPEQVREIYLHKADGKPIRTGKTEAK